VLGRAITHTHTQQQVLFVLCAHRVAPGAIGNGSFVFNQPPPAASLPPSEIFAPQLTACYGSGKSFSRVTDVFLLTTWVANLSSLCSCFCSQHARAHTHSVHACTTRTRALAGELVFFLCVWILHTLILEQAGKRRITRSVSLTGLGKTFQSVCLLWTMLTQGVGGKPSIKRAAVICPTSLVKVINT
jgi:hypothetical protein